MTPYGRRACDEADDWRPALLLGAAQPAAGDDGPSGYPVAVLWLPDPRAAAGWTLHRVERDEEDGPPRRPMGFR